jgi:hypothetical protein
MSVKYARCTIIVSVDKWWFLCFSFRWDVLKELRSFDSFILLLYLRATIIQLFYWVVPSPWEGPPSLRAATFPARRHSFETHAATAKPRNTTPRSWTPCATISATRLTSCAPRLSRTLTLSPPKNEAVDVTGFARSAGPSPPTTTSCDTVGAAMRCTTAAR